MISLKFTNNQIKEYEERGFIFKIGEGKYKLFDERENILIEVLKEWEEWEENKKQRRIILNL